MTNVAIHFCSKHDNQLFYASKTFRMTTLQGSNAMGFFMVEGGNFRVNMGVQYHRY